MGKTALVLSGGGARGRWQAGVIHALHDRGFRWDMIIGTSVGSINAAGYSILGPEALSLVWETEVTGAKGIVSPNGGLLKYIKGGYNFLFRGGFYVLTPLEKLLNKHFAGKSPVYAKDVFACKVSLVTGDVVYAHHSEPDFVQSVLGSSAIPGIMAPIGEWQDGGIREMSPLRKAILEGADKITVVITSPWRLNPPVDERMPRNFALWNIIRTVEVVTHEIFVNDIKNCKSMNSDPDKKEIEVSVWAPAEDLPLGILDFGPKNSREIWSMGYQTGIGEPVLRF